MLKLHEKNLENRKIQQKIRENSEETGNKEKSETNCVLRSRSRFQIN